MDLSDQIVQHRHLVIKQRFREFDLNSVLHLAQELELKTISEGVEIRSQVDYLKEMDCDYIQGLCSQEDPDTFPMDNSHIREMAEIILYNEILFRRNR